MKQLPYQTMLPFSLSPGSSSPNNGRFFVPNILNVSAGTTVTWTNRDLTWYKSFEVEQLHTVTSGTLESRAIGENLTQAFLVLGRHSSILLIRQEHLITSVQSILS